MPVTFQQNQYLFEELRAKFPVFHYRNYTLHFIQNSLIIQFEFSLDDQYTFTPQLTIPCQPVIAGYHDINRLNNLAFHIGLIELISYWKAACPPQVMVHCGKLTEAQIRWWKQQYFYGLGEFFYLNGIHTDMENFMQLNADTDAASYEPFSMDTAPTLLVPVGGGKDSAVTLNFLKKTNHQVIPFILNPRQANLMTTRAEGFHDHQMLMFYRTLDPLLLQLNDQGFLNGHTPFSALLAFMALLGATITRSSAIVLSNEASANEDTLPGTGINHQYSKTFTFESAFRQYVSSHITTDIDYFSLLRPWNELQIARYFSGLPHQFAHFRSCNAGSKTNSWCGKCPKCLYTWIILAPFIEDLTLENIFGENLLRNNNLYPLLEQLTGLTSARPFECVGTVEEINATLFSLFERYAEENMPVLLKNFRTNPRWKNISRTSLNNFLRYENPDHFVPESLMEILRKEMIHEANY